MINYGVLKEETYLTMSWVKIVSLQTEFSQPSICSYLRFYCEVKFLVKFKFCNFHPCNVVKIFFCANVKRDKNKKYKVIPSVEVINVGEVSQCL